MLEGIETNRQIDRLVRDSVQLLGAIKIIQRSPSAFATALEIPEHARIRPTTCDLRAALRRR